MDRRFYCESSLIEDDSVELSLDESRHLRTVLRAKVGEGVCLMNGHGGVADAEIIGLGGKRGVAICRVTHVENCARPSLQIHLYVAPPRGKGMAEVVRMATEMGVAAITPILCRRGTGRPDEKSISSWRTTAITAIKQSKNPHLPELFSPLPLAEALAHDPAPGVVGWVPDDGPVPSSEVELASDVSLFIGPEGGFDSDEIRTILNAGISPVSFGPWVLRVSTAVVAGMAALNQKVQP